MKSDFSTVSLASIADIQTGPFGSQLHKEDYVDIGTPIVTVEHLGNKRFSEQNLPCVSDADKERLKKYTLNEGDIVFSRVGSVDRCSYVSREYAGWMFSGRCLRVRPTSEIDSQYLYYYFTLETVKAFVRGIATGATMPSINTKFMGEIPITYPNLDTQKRIADVLSSIDSKIEYNNRINQNLVQQLELIYNEMYPYDTDAIPDGWRSVHLGDVCESISVKHDFKKDELIFLNTGDIEDGCFLHSNYSAVESMPGQAKKTIKKDDILYSEIRPINRHYAYVSFNAEDYVVSTKLMVIRAKGIDSRRLYHYLTSKSVIDELQHEAETRSGTFPQIRFDNIQRLKMIIALPEQEKAFCEILHSYYRKIDANIAENERLSLLRDSILPKLMSGELDVSETDL